MMGSMRWPVKQKQKELLNNDSYLFSSENVSLIPYYSKTVDETILTGFLVVMYEVFVNVGNCV